MVKISIIGGGRWGVALYFALSFKNNLKIASRRELKGYNQVALDEALKSEFLVIAIASQAINRWLKDNFIFRDQKIIVASKGIDASSGRFLNEIFEEYVPRENLAFLSGPSFATEVLSSLPTAITIHSYNLKLASTIASFFPPFIKTYTSSDVIGGEIAGAYKNVIAIAAGICDGLNLGNNAKAALVSRGLVEMARFGSFFGANIETFLGLPGSGDLFLTSNSTLSRNYKTGLMLASGKKKDEIELELKEVAEGIATSYAIKKISIEKSIYTPIANEVFLILEGKDPKRSLQDLLNR